VGKYALYAAELLRYASIPGYVGVRDTKLGTASPILAFTSAEWAAFVEVCARPSLTSELLGRPACGGRSFAILPGA
jgi:hypothetical protein